MPQQTLTDIISALTIARVDLEQGGKYDWNDDLQHCDNILKLVIETLKELKGGE